MSHKHDVIDVNEALVIDGINKTITNPTGSKIVLAQFDHNSQRVTCKIPRYIEDHDMLTCDEVQIHYDNVSNGTSISARSTNSDVYDVPDLKVISGDEDNIICTWLISQNATQYAGVVKFKLKFVCYGENAVEDYVWNTHPSTDIIEVYAGFDNAKAIIEQNADIIEQWRQALIESAARFKGVISEADFETLFDKDVGDMYIVEDADGYREFAICVETSDGENDAVWFRALDVSTVLKFINEVIGFVNANTARINDLQVALDSANTALSELDSRVGQRPLRYVGTFISKADLESGHPNPKDGDVAVVSSLLGNAFYMWDKQYQKWIVCDNDAYIVEQLRADVDTLKAQDLLSYKGEVPTGPSLYSITDKEIGDVYFVDSTDAYGQRFYMWDGVDWIPLCGRPSQSVTEGDNNTVTGDAVYKFVLANGSQGGGGNMDYKGEQSTSNMDSITDKKIGDVYFVSSLNQFYMWDGTDWKPLGSSVEGVLRYRGTYLGELPRDTRTLYAEDRRIGDVFIHDAYYTGTGEHGAYLWDGTKWESLNRRFCTRIYYGTEMDQERTVPTARAVVDYIEERITERRPDLTGFATEKYVDDAIAGIRHPAPDLTGYATEQFVNDAVATAITEYDTSAKFYLERALALLGEDGEGE